MNRTGGLDIHRVMPLDSEFRHHLHELMVQTNEELRDELAAHKRQLIWKARQSHNSAALPLAYSDASIHAFHTRVKATIATYLNALKTCNIAVDASVEKEMLQYIRVLTSTTPSLHFPPAMTVRNAEMVKRAHKMELARVGTSLYREAANRLREVKMRARGTSADSSAVSMPTPSVPFTIASVAKNLAELKALAIEDQAILLLRRLAHMFPQMQRTGGLHKGNILLADDPYALAIGFPTNENLAVRQYLLGAPWTRLVNEGLLVDLAGSGFFLLSEEGLAAASCTTPRRAAPPVKLTDNDSVIPTAFVSYSWDGDEHKQWVLELAEKLRVQGGVDVILDRWHLPLGGDRTLFMERGVTGSDFVLVVCTPNYAIKANNRKGGVGYEAMIITSQLAKQIEQNRFIPVLRSGEWDSSLPIWIQSKIGVDLRGDPYRDEEYKNLVRTLHDDQVLVPSVGPKPVFLITPPDAIPASKGRVTALESAASGVTREAEDTPIIETQPKLIAYADLSPRNVLLPAIRPCMVPIRYGIRKSDNRYGLFVVNENDGAAYEISIGDVEIGPSKLHFWNECLDRLTKASGEYLFECDIQESENSLLMGSGLRQEMVRHNVTELPITVRYKDAENRWYITRSRIERNSGGLSVRFVSQEMLPA
jgi:TIR domain